MINSARAIAIQQIQVQTEDTGVPPTNSPPKPETDTDNFSSDQPRILYQCGDCDELFKSLVLWQHHRKEGSCLQSVSGTALVNEPEPEQDPQDPSVDCSPSVEAAASEGLRPESVETPIETVSESAPSTSNPEVEEAPPASNPDDSSPTKKRGANKKSKPEPVLLCVDCGSSFGLVSELVAHRKTQHGFEEALHRCSVCGESFLNTTLFLYHRKQHRQKEEEKEVVVHLEEELEEVCPQSNGTDEQRQDADFCSTTVTSSYTQPELFMCTQCGESSSDEAGLVAHRREKHGLQEALHTCCYCSQDFMNTTQYLYHLRVHRFTSGREVGNEAETGVETSTIKPQDAPQTSKRLLSPPASSSESGFPLAKRSRPSIRIHSGINAPKGELNKMF